MEKSMPKTQPASEQDKTMSPLERRLQAAIAKAEAAKRAAVVDTTVEKEETSRRWLARLWEAVDEDNSGAIDDDEFDQVQQAFINIGSPMEDEDRLEYRVRVKTFLDRWRDAWKGSNQEEEAKEGADEFNLDVFQICLSDFLSEFANEQRLSGADAMVSELLLRKRAENRVKTFLADDKAGSLIEQDPISGHWEWKGHYRPCGWPLCATFSPGGATPGQCRSRRLTVGFPGEDDSVAQFLGMYDGSMGQVTELETRPDLGIDYSDLSDDILVDALCSQEHATLCAHLTTLDLSGCSSLSDYAISKVCHLCPRLDRLCVEGTGVTAPEGARSSLSELRRFYKVHAASSPARPRPQPLLKTHSFRGQASNENRSRNSQSPAAAAYPRSPMSPYAQSPSGKLRVVVPMSPYHHRANHHKSTMSPCGSPLARCRP